MSARGGQVEFPAQMAEPSPFLLWDSSLSMRASGGYNSNPSLAYLGEFRQPAAFFEYGGDLMFYRLPADGDSAYIFVSGDDRRYFNADQVPGQQNFLTQFKYDHESPSWWNAGASLVWMYANQVIDLSDLDNGVGTAQVKALTIALRPSFSARLGTNWLAGFELPLMRQGLTAPADGYFEVGPQLLLTRKLPNASTASIGYSWTWRPYDDSPLLTPGGEIISGSLERLRYNSVNVRWQQNWDRDRAWRTTLFGGFTATRDNGLGYYDYNRFRVGGAVQYQVGRWILSGDGSAGWYQYVEQTTAPEETALRERQEFSVGVQVSFQVSDRVQWVTRFTWETSISNIPQDTYDATTASMGLEVEF
jgi:hypothetical protein